MARMFEPDQEQIAGYQEWLSAKSQKIQDFMKQFDPWSLYHMKTTGKRVSIVGVVELETGEIQLTVNVSADYNVVHMERNVFGIKAEDLEPCDLPGPGERVGLIGASE